MTKFIERGDYVIKKKWKCINTNNVVKTLGKYINNESNVKKKKKM